MKLVEKGFVDLISSKVCFGVKASQIISFITRITCNFTMLLKGRASVLYAGIFFWLEDVYKSSFTLIFEFKYLTFINSTWFYNAFLSIKKPFFFNHSWVRYVLNTAFLHVLGNGYSLLQLVGVPFSLKIGEGKVWNYF